MMMDPVSLAAEDKPQLPSISAPHPQPGRPTLPSRSDSSHGLRPPPGPYEPAWSRSYFPDQRGHHPPFTAPPPREPAHQHPAPDMYQRPGSLPSPAGSRPPESSPYHRPMNGDVPPHPPPPPPTLQGPPPPPPPPTEYRARLPYPSSDAHHHPPPPPNGDVASGPAHPPPPPGPPHGMPMMHPPPDGMQRQYHPHTPLPPPTPAVSYEPNSYFLNQPGALYSQRQRRTTRAQQACDQCRARKAKCDEGRPSCGHCKESQIQCNYKDVPPHKHERATQMVLERIQLIDEKISQLDNAMQSNFRTLLSNQDAKPSPNLPAPSVESKPSFPPKVEMVDLLSKVTPPEQSQGTPSSQKQSTGVEDAKEEPVKVNASADDDELSIPIEHTTAAHKLLLWPSIQNLLPAKIDDDYVMTLEESRGPIRPYGRGEGEVDRSWFTVQQPASPMVGSPSSHEEEAYLASSPGSRFGTGLELYHGRQSTKPARDHHVGGLSPRGTLNLDPDLIRSYHESYIQNMHILHPFLSLPTLDAMISSFIRNYSPAKRTYSAPFVHSKADPASIHQRAPKRKRSGESQHFAAGFDTPGSDQPAKPPMIHRSMDNAIVLLVLALGEICNWKTEIPGPVPDPPRKGSLFAQGIVSDTGFHNSTPLHGHSPTDSYMAHERRHSHSNSASNPNTPDQGLRNMDVVPGMAYYALASDILGNLQGGNDLAHAQACLLAALYTGQLAHPFSSHGWISQAARACQVLVRPRRYNRMPDGPVKDLICLVFWTCLQLESDILAELDLPASGISRLEGRMNLPKGMVSYPMTNDIDSTSTMMYYSAQVHLRKVLNQVHTDLYKAEKSRGERRTQWSTKVQEALVICLESWRAGLPSYMQWDDKDPPATDINVARLRAKYYGARYIIHRPLLHHALHPMAQKPPVPAGASGPAASPALSAVSSAQSHVSPSVAHAYQSEPMERWPSEMGPPLRTRSSQDPLPLTAKELDPKVLAACVTCVEAAMNSTTAFDGVPGRPIVTNIFGTAHAQFGNMLVLAATYTSNLRSLVDGEKLRMLLDRTIKFLMQSRYISPTLRKDAEILTVIRRELFDQPQQNPSTSFSSET